MVRVAPSAAFTLWLMAGLLAVCAGSAHAAPPRLDWGGACYVGFAEHVERLAGKDAVDCGLHRHGTVKHHASARRCMRKALAAGRSYRVGEVTYLAGGEAAGTTVDACTVAIEGPAALPVYLWYFRDSPVLNTGLGRLWVQRCHDVLVPEKSGDLRLFVTDDCVDAHTLLPEVFASPSGQHAEDSSAAVRPLP